MSNVYTKINTIHKRYIFETKDIPNKKWVAFKNKIILNEFSDNSFKYLYNCLWEAYSKIDGTCSKIIFFPSTGEIRVGGKTDKADSMHGQFEMLQAIGERIKPQLKAMFPKETARFTPIKDKNTNKVEYWDMSDHLGLSTVVPTSEGQYGVRLEEVPIYIYGEYFGTGVQKCGSRYIQNGNGFVVFDIQQQGWWTPKDVRDSLCKCLGLETVPFLGVMTLEEIERKVRNGFTTQYDKAADPTMIEEGIVARPVIPLCSGNGNRVIVKVKYCDYVELDRVKKEFSDEEFNEFEEWYYTNVEAK